MIYDHRTYVCKYGMVAAHVALYEKMGFATQRRHLGEPVLYSTTEVGNINAIIHIWAYKDLAERQQKRAALGADPEWKAYISASRDLGALDSQQTQILVRAGFLG